MGFFGKESTCNAGDPGLIPGSGRSTEAGIGYPLQYSWASLVARLVKNPLAMWETWVRSLGWEDALEEGMATHSSVLAWRTPMDSGAWQATVHRVTKFWWLDHKILATRRWILYHSHLGSPDWCYFMVKLRLGIRSKNTTEVKLCRVGFFDCSLW